MKAEGNLQDCYAALSSKGFEPCDAANLAELRAKERKAWEGTWVANSIVYDGKSVLITDGKRNPILKDIDTAELDNSAGKEYTLASNQIKTLRNHARTNVEDAIKTGVLKLEDFENVPVGQLSRRPYTGFLFRQNAGIYAALCKGEKVNTIPVYFLSEEERNKVGEPFARQLWIRIMSCGSEIANSNDIHCGRKNGSWGTAYGINLNEETSPTTPKSQSMDEIVEAMKKGHSFEYEGRKYAPVKSKARVSK